MNYQIGKTLAMIEKETILAALKFFDNNQTKTASALGITTKTIQNKLSIYAKEQDGKANSKDIKTT